MGGLTINDLEEDKDPSSLPYGRGRWKNEKVSGLYDKK